MSTAQLIPPETGIKGLRASAGSPLPFARQVHAHSFVLERPPGAVLIYGAGEAEADLAAAASPTRRYLSHQHEAVYAAELPDVPLFVHDADRGPVEEHLAVRGTFTRRHVLDNDLEVIRSPAIPPAPRHSCGTRARSGCSSAATRSTSPTASGWARCSIQATAANIWRASSSCAASSSMPWCPGRQTRASRR